MESTKLNAKIFFLSLFFLNIFVSAFVGGTVSWWLVKNYQTPASIQTTSEQTSLVLKDTREESATIASVAKVNPSVVSIVVTKDLPKIQTGYPSDSLKKLFEFGQNNKPQFNGQAEEQETSSGTGFFISQDGLILTNRHVLQGEEVEYSVITQSGEEFNAKILAIDSFNDLAVMKIQTDKKTPVVTLGNSNKIKVGQTVLAIGNSLGEFQNTVTKGIISGIGRNIRANDGTRSGVLLEGVLQTDAAINPGNSGGPLINLAGEVIGVNTAISQGGQLIGFAIGIEDAKKTIESVVKNGKIVRPFLGVRSLMVTPALQEKKQLGVDYGALIIAGKGDDEPAIVPGSPAQKSGLMENDIILQINNKKIDRKHSLAKILSQFNPGDMVILKILRDGEEQDISVVLAEA